MPFQSACNARDRGDKSLIPGSGRSPGGRLCNPLQDSCLENPMDRGALAGYSPRGHKQSDTAERLSTATPLQLLKVGRGVASGQRCRWAAMQSPGLRQAPQDASLASSSGQSLPSVSGEAEKSSNTLQETHMLGLFFHLENVNSAKELSMCLK